MFPISDSTPARRFPFLNIAIIIATVYVFYLQLTAVSPQAFIEKYALISSLVDFGNPQSLLPFVTAIFLHGGFLHIISNMWFLWVFGDNIEEHFGFVLFFVLYFLSGIAGNVLQYLLMPNSSIPMIGASGAVAGILGAYFVLFPHSKIKTLIPIFFYITFINIPAFFMLGYWFLLQIISGLESVSFANSQMGGVAFWAHVGGFAIGVIFAKIFGKKEVFASS